MSTACAFGSLARPIITSVIILLKLIETLHPAETSCHTTTIDTFVEKMMGYILIQLSEQLQVIGCERTKIRGAGIPTATLKAIVSLLILLWYSEYHYGSDVRLRLLLFILHHHFSQRNCIQVSCLGILKCGSMSYCSFQVSCSKGVHGKANLGFESHTSSKPGHGPIADRRSMVMLSKNNKVNCRN